VGVQRRQPTNFRAIFSVADASLDVSNLRDVSFVDSKVARLLVDGEATVATVRRFAETNGFKVSTDHLKYGFSGCLTGCHAGRMLNVAEQENVTARHLAAVSHRYARFPHFAAPMSELVAALGLRDKVDKALHLMRKTAGPREGTSVPTPASGNINVDTECEELDSL
jgi:hypothetical protein